MNKTTLGVIVIALAALLIVLQTCARSGAFAQERDEVKVLGIGLGSGAARGAGNYSLIPRFEIQALGANHASEILNRRAGFNIQHGSGQEHLTAIRSPVLTGGAGAGSFLFLEDGVPLRAAGFGNVNGLFEAIGELADSIEATRGPGSALYGSNSVHGVVNFQSRAPERTRAGAPEGDALIRFGLNPFSTKLIASVTNAIGDSSAARLGFSYLRDSGWRDSTGTEQFKAQIRLDNTFGKLKSKTLLSAHRLNQETGGYLTDDDTGLDFSYKYRALTFTNNDPDAYRKAYAVRAQNNLLWQYNKNNQLNLTSWLRWTKMDFLMHFLPATPTEKNAHFSFGTRPIWQYQLSFFGDVNFNFGAEGEYTRGTLSETQTQGNLGPFFTGTHYDYVINTATLALFTQNDWALSDDRTTIYFGVRAEWTRYDYDNKTASGTNLNSTSDGALYRPADTADDFFTITPKIGLNYRLPKLYNHQIYTFTDYTRGQRAPQTTDLYRLRYRDRNAKFKPETLDSVELGLRGAQGALRWELVGFFMDKRNYHFRDSNFEPVVNGKTRHAGLELDFFAPLWWDLSLKGAFTYAHHWYNFDRNEGEIKRIKKGDDIDTAPRTLLNMELAYNHTYGDLAIEYIRVGNYYTDAENEHSYGGHNLFNLRSAVKVGEDIHLFFNIFNLTDKRYADRADFAFGSRRYFPGQPRAYYLGLKGNF